jgi:hypothetical protein
VSLLQSEGILRDAATHVAAGREFHFVSTLPSIDLDALVDIAERSDDYKLFARHIEAVGAPRRAAFDLLASEWGGREAAYATLQQVRVWSPDERQLQRDNLTYAEWIIEGQPSAAVGVLGEIVRSNLTVAFTNDRLWTELATAGLRRNPLFDDTTLPTLVAEQTDRWLNTVTRELLQPTIARSQTDDALVLLQADTRPVMIAGEAGIGKSAVVAAIVEKARADGWPVVAFRLDRVNDVQTPRQLGARFDLPTSPIIALGSIAQKRPALFVCDQLDAVSHASGRAVEVFDVLDELLREVERFPNVRVLLACRQFDIDNDQRLRSLADNSKPRHAVTVTVPRLEDDTVLAAVGVMGLDETHLDQRQIELLRSPLNLVLLREVATEVDALTFTTVRDLLERYWQTKRRQVTERRLPAQTRFDDVISRLVTAMSDSQQLSVPEAALFAEGLDDDASVLVSEHVIVHESGRYAFFHESLFDYAFVRGWLTTNRSILEFLLAGEQELFRRAQVRQVLSYVRDTEKARFPTEVRAVLDHEAVRFHVKDVVLALLRSLNDPTPDELQVVLEFLERKFIWRDRLELLLRTEPWFDRLEEDGVFATWLASGDRELEIRAVQILGTAGRNRGDRVAGLIEPHQAHPEIGMWLLFCARFIDLETSRALFDLLLRAVCVGKVAEEQQDGIWLAAHSLGTSESEWAVELLAAWFVERPAALATEHSRVVDLGGSDYGLLELIRNAADGAPAAFAGLFLPYMQRVMELASTGEHLPLGDWHFGSPIWNQHISDAADALYSGMQSALAAVAGENPQRLRELVLPLTTDTHQAAQNLLYGALVAAGEAHANWAAELLLRGEYALEAGYGDDPYWTTRELLQATSPHMDDALFASVEEVLVAHAPEWERRTPKARGHASFTLLSAMDEARLSALGRARLRELRDKFQRHEPKPPRGIVGGVVGSPIGLADARRMNDEQWLSAMKAYKGEARDWSNFLRGGAFELASQVLQQLTKEDPDRFARLALRIDASYDGSYLDAILMGLGESEGDFDPFAIYDAIEHAAAVGGHDRWLGYALKRLYRAEIPLEIFRLLVARAKSGGQDGFYEDDPYMSGINDERGANAHTLAILLSFDDTGRLAGELGPHVEELVDSESTPVRTTVAEVLRALYPWQPSRSVQGFLALVATEDVKLFTTRQFEELAAAVIFRDVAAALPLIRLLLAHAEEDAREHGSRLATYAATDGGQDALLSEVVSSPDIAIRRGAATVLADRGRWVVEPTVHDNLIRLFSDADESVRSAAARVVMRLRGAELAKYEHLLQAFVESPALSGEIAQLAITLDGASGEIVNITLALARRFLALFESDIGDIQTHAAGDARQIGELVLRAYSQAQDAGQRSEILDAVDRLLALNAYGFADAVEQVARPSYP